MQRQCHTAPRSLLPCAQVSFAMCVGLFCHAPRSLLPCAQVSFAMCVGLFCHAHRSLLPCAKTMPHCAQPSKVRIGSRATPPCLSLSRPPCTMEFPMPILRCTCMHVCAKTNSCSRCAPLARARARAWAHEHVLSVCLCLPLSHSPRYARTHARTHAHV